MMATKKDFQLVHIQFDLGLLKKLDDFRFTNRIDSRSQAARWLVKAALEAKMKPPKEKEQP